MNGIIALAVFFAVIAGMLWMIVAPLWFAARDSRDDRFRMELPDLSGQSLSVILKLYGRPLKRLDGNGVTNFYFANGVVVADAGGGVAYYGIFDPLHLDI